MKKFANIFCIVAVVSLVMFWVAERLFVVTAQPLTLGQLFLGIPSPPPSLWHSIVTWSFIVLSAPMSLMLSVSDHAISTPVYVLLSLANSIVWGLCLGLPIYIIKQKTWSHAA